MTLGRFTNNFQHLMRTYKISFVSAAIALSSLSLTACGGGRGAGTDAEGNPIGLGLTVRRLSGNNQTAKKNVPFALPLVARVESPDGSPVPEMSVTCSQATSTDAYFTGPTKFKTDVSGVISTTVFAPTTYDQIVRIECAIDDTPNMAVFTLETVFTVDYITFTDHGAPTPPSGTYTASDSVPMSSFSVEMYDTDGAQIDITGGGRHWIDISVVGAGMPQPFGDASQDFTNGVATFTDVRYRRADTITLRATHNRSGEYVEQVVVVDPNVVTQTIAVLPGQTYDWGYATLAEAITGNFNPFVSADDTFNVEIRAVDDYFNTVSAYGGAVSVETPNDLSDTHPGASSFTAGVETFTVSPVQAKNTHVIRPVSALTDNDSSTYTVNAGAPANLITLLPGQTFDPGQTSLGAAITGAVTDRTAGVAFNAVVYATDAEFNQVSTTPTVTLATSDVADTDPAAQALVAGTRTFSVTNRTASVGHTVTPSSAGYASNASSTYTVLHNAATQMVVTTQPPASLQAGDEIAVVAEIRDAYGNIVTTGPDSTASVTMSLVAPSTGTLTGTLTKAAVGGVVDFTGDGIYANLIGNKVIRLTKASTVGGGGTASVFVNTNSFLVTHGDASELVWTTEPANNTGAGVAFNPIVEIQDAYGNLVTTGADSTTTLSINLQAGIGVLLGTTNEAAVGGVANFTGNGLNIEVTGLKTLRVTKPDTTGGGGTISIFEDGTPFTIIHGVATQVVFATQPADPTLAGAEIAPVLEIQDSFNNVVYSGADATANVTLSLETGTGLIYGTVTIAAVAGVADYSGMGVYLDTTGVKTIRATKASTLPTGTASMFVVSDPFTIDPAAASELVYTTQPTNPTVAGTDITPVIEIRDSLGNLVNIGVDSTANVTLNLQAGTGTLSGTVIKAAVGGVVTFNGADNVAIDLVGAKVLRATKEDTSGGGGTTSFFEDSASFTINHAPANELYWSVEPTDPTVAGANILTTIQVRDAFTNIVTTGPDATASITLSKVAGTGTLSGTLTKSATAGVVSFTATESVDIDLIGTKTLEASKASTLPTGTAVITQNSANFDIVHAPANNIAFTTEPVDSVAGTDLLPAVTIYDVYGNVVTSGAGSTQNVVLTIQSQPGGATLSGTATLAAVNGVATWAGTDNLALDKVGAYTLRAAITSPVTNDISASFNITHAGANNIAFTTEPANSVAGTDLLPVVTIYDVYGNVVTTGADSTQNVTLTINSGTGGATLSGTTVVAASSGVATWVGADNLNIDLVGAYTLQAAIATPVATDVSASFNITHAAADNIAFTTEPVNSIAGTDLLPVVTIYDVYGNVVTTGAGATQNVTLTINSGTGGAVLGGTTVRAASGGVATWLAAQSLDIDLIGTYTLQASISTPAAADISASFDITHAAASAIAFTTEPVNTVAGVDLVPAVTIYDAFGNVVTTGAGATQNVTLTINSQPGGATLSGTNVLAAVGGVATWTGVQSLDLDKVGAYTLQAAISSPAATDISASFNITHAPANNIYFSTQPPDPAGAGFELPVVVTVRDAFGNTVTTGADSNVTITITQETGTGVLAGTTNEAAVSGVANFTGNNVNINFTGTKSLRATKADTSGGGGTASMFVISDDFDIIHGAATQVVFLTQPVNSIAGADLVPAVEIQDALGNRVTTGPDSTALITITKNSGPVSGAFSGTVALNAVAGLATWTAVEALDLDVVGTYELLATKSSTLPTGTASLNVVSNSFTISHAPASNIAFTTEPVTSVAGTDLVPVVTIYDVFGNVVTTGAGSTQNVTLTINSQPGGATLAGTATLAAVAGVATWTGVQSLDLDIVGAYTLQAAIATPVTTDISASFNITHAPANNIAFTTEPVTSVAGTDLLPVVTIYDAFGNVVTTGAGSTQNVTLTINSQPGGATLSGTTVRAAVAGVATWAAAQSLDLDIVGAYTLQAAISTPAATDISASFNITHAPANNIAFTTEPVTSVAGADLVPVVTIYDVFGNIVTTGAGSTQNVTLTINSQPGGATLSGTAVLAAVGGVATWTGAQALDLDIVGAYTLQAAISAPAATDISASFNITHAPANNIAFTTEPVTSVAGTDLVPVITIYDAFGNVVTTGAGSTQNVTLTINSGTGGATLAGTATVAAVAGVATWNAGHSLDLDLVGAYTLQAAISTPAATDISASFNITHAAANNIAFTTSPSNSVAGTDLLPVVTIYDAFGNVVTTGAGSTQNVTLTINTGTGGATLGGTTVRAAVAGVATWSAVQSLDIDLVGSYTLQAAIATPVTTDISASFDITPAAAASIAFVTHPSTGVAGTNIVPSVEILDTFGNRTTSDNTSIITLSILNDPSVGATLAGDLTVPVTAGLATWTGAEAMYLDKVGTGFTLRATLAAFTDDSNAFNVTHAAANNIAFTDEPDNSAAGANLLPQVTIYDVYGNVVTTGAGSTQNVTLTINSGTGGATLSGTAVLAASNGVATWLAAQSLDIDLVGTYTLQAAIATPVATDISASFVIAHAPAANIAFTTEPVNSVAGTNLLPVVTIYDAFGNVVTTGAGSTQNVTLTINSGTGGAALSGTTVLAASGGVATWLAAQSLDIDLVGTYTLQAAIATPADTAISASFDITHAPAANIAFTTDPANSVAGTNLLPVVTIYDTFGNVVTTGAGATQNVTLTINSGTGGATLSGTAVVAAVGGVATWVAGHSLDIDLVGTYTLQAAISSPATTDISASFNITHAPANNIYFSSQPPDPSGAGFELPVVVTVRDAFGNTVSTGADSTVTITISKETGTGVLGGTVNEAAAGGVANFTGNNVNIDLTGTKSLRATKADTSGGGGTASMFVVSNDFDINHGAASQLVYIAQPVNTVAGDHLLPVVEIRDTLGNRVNTGPDSTATITITKNSGPGSGVFSGTVALTAVNGRATWTATEAMDLDIVGTYELLATKSDTTGTGGTAAIGLVSNTFDITHAPAANIAFTTSPVNSVAGTDLLPVVTIYDVFGNVVTTGAGATQNVTLTINSGTGGATLSGTAVVAASNGVATWAGSDNLNIDLIGTYTLQAAISSPADTAVSASFDITHAPANNIAFTLDPVDSVAGTNLLPAVTIYDAFGNIVTTGAGATQNVTLTINSGTGGATLSGTAVLAASGGVATWAAAQSLDIDLVGAYTLQAAIATPATTDISASFNITHAPAANIAFTTDPVDSAAGANLLPEVTIYDSFGNIVTTGAGATQNVTLTINSGTGGATLSGTAVLAASGGVATWLAAQSLDIDLVGTYTLQAAISSPADTAVSASFDITPAAAASIAFVTQPSSGVAGTNLVPSVEILDSFGNRRTGDNASIITMSIQTDPSAGATLAGDVTVQVASGLATWTATEAMFLDLVGTGYVLRATLGGFTDDSNAFNVTHAAAASLAFTGQPANTVAGEDILPVVTIRDSFGNTVTTGGGSSQNVTLTINSGTGGATLGGTVVLAASAGVATWAGTDNLNIDLVGTYDLQAAIAAPVATIVSSAFNITPAAAASIAFVTQPSTGVAGTNLVPSVEILDSFGNRRTGDSTSIITMSIQTDPSAGATLAGDLTVQVASGLATWTGVEAMYLNLVGTGYVLRATLGGFTDDSNAFNVTPAAAASIAFVTQPSTGVAGTNLVPSVEILDSFGNRRTGDNASIITMSIQTDPSAGATLAGDTTVQVASGLATWTGVEAMYLNLVGTGYVLRATLGGFTDDSNAFNVTPAAAASIAFVTQPATGVAGTNLVPSVEILDTYGNRRTGDNASIITMSIQTDPSAGATLAGDVTVQVASGLATWTATEAMFLDLVGTGYVLRATLGGFTDDSNAFNVTHAAAANIAFTTTPSNSLAGANLLPEVTIYDTYGNVVTTGAGSTQNVTLTINSGTGGATLSGTAVLAATNGVATWLAAQSLDIDLVGTYTLQAAIATPADTAVSGSFDITPAAAASIAFVTQPASGVAGTNLVPSVEILDSFGNRRTGDSASIITMSIQTDPSAGATLAGDVTVQVASGLATWTGVEAMYLNLAGTGYVLRATLGGFTDDSNAFNVTPAAAASIAFVTQPSTGVAGTNLVPSVEILDTYGNRRTGDSASIITMSILNDPSAGATLAGDLTVQVASGLATWTATEAMFLDLVGTGYTLRATLGGFTDDSNAFNVTPAAAASIAFVTQPSTGVAGTNLVPTVEILDTYGNRRTGDNASIITMSIQTDPSAGATLAGDTTVQVASGLATWTGVEAMYLNLVGTGYVLRATLGGFTDDSNAFNVTPAAAASIAFVTQPSTGVAGTNLLPSVEILDTYGNRRTGDSASIITMSILNDPSAGATLAGDLTVQVASGLATWTATEAMFLNLVGTGYTLRATLGGFTDDSNAFNVTHAAAANIAFTTTPSNSAAGANLLPEVTIYDTYGNVVTTGAGSTQNVTLTINSGTGGATLSGTAVLAATNGVATWLAAQSLDIDLVGTYTLQAAIATPADTAVSGSFDITPAAAASIAFVTQPSTGVAGTNLVPSVEVLDTFGNRRTGDNASIITMSIQTDPSAGATLAGDVTVQVASGLATWTGVEAMYLDLVGTGYVLRATLGGFTDDSNTFNVTHAAAASIAFTGQPANTVAGEDILPVVTIRDSFGNTVTTGGGASQNVTLTINSGTGGATLGGTAVLAASGGVATWIGASNLNIDLLGTYTLQAAIASPVATVNSASFDITPAAAASIAFVTHPSTGVAGTNLVPSVEILDAFGNRRTNDSTSIITMSIQTDPSAGATLAGDVTVQVASGLATWTATEAMFLDLVGTGYVLRATLGGFTDDSNAFNVTHAAAANIAFTTTPSNSLAGANLLPEVTIYDTYGNVVTTGAGSTQNVTLTINSGTGGATLSGTAVLAATNGVATWLAAQSLDIDLVGTYTLQAAIATPADTAVSGSFDITPAAAASIAFVTQPATGVAGTNLVPSVEILDTYGNRRTGDNASVITMSIQTDPSAGATLAGDTTVQVASGLATWTATEAMFLDLVGTGYVLRATLGGFTDDSNAFNVTHAAAANIAFTTTPSNSLAGADLLPEVTIYDTYGNIVTTGAASTQNVTLTINSGTGGATLGGTAVLAATNGVATWLAAQSLDIDLVGTYTLQAAIATPADIAVSGSFDITPAAAASIAFVTQPSSGVAGTNLVPSVEILDSFGNRRTGDNASIITMSIQTDPSAGATLAGDVTVQVASGLATWTATEAMFLNLVGTGYVLRATLGGFTDDSNAFNVTPAAAASIAFVTQPSTGVAGTNLVPSVEILDTYGNRRTGDSASIITMSILNDPSAGATLAGDLTVQVASGLATWTATEAMFLNLVGTGYTLRATLGGFTDDSNAFNVTPAAAASIAFVTQPSTGVAGTNLVPSVEILDTYGNRRTGDSTSIISMSIQTDPSAGATLAGDTTVQVASGLATWTGVEAMFLNLVGTGYVLRATLGGFTDDSNAFNVTHAAAANIAFTTTPSNSAAGANLLPEVTIYDTYGNVVTTGAGSTQNVTLTINSGTGGATLSGTAVLAATNGVATWLAAQSLDIDLAGTYTLQAAIATPADTAISGSFDITAAAAASIAFVTQPSTGAAGTNLVPSVEILDTYGNRRTGDSTSIITMSIQTDPSAGATLAGDVTVQVASGLATWTATEAMFLDLVGTGYVLRATLGGFTDDSNAFNVTHAAAATIVFTTQPSNSLAGADLVPAVTIRDSYGNTVSTGVQSSQNITITKASGPGALNGTAVLAASAGVATWTGVQSMDFTLIGTYELQAAIGNPVTTVTSSTFDITHAAAADLVFTSQPAGVDRAADILTVVTIRDAYGNDVTTGASSTAAVVLTKQSGTGTLNGTTSVNAIAGVATWDADEDLNFTICGSKTLRATLAAITEDSNAFSITCPSAPTSLTRNNPSTSPNNDTTPEIRVGGIVVGYDVDLFTANDCLSGNVGSVTNAAGTTVDITSSALTEAVYNFYATQTDTYGNESACSAATVSYDLDTTLPANPTALTLGDDTSPDSANSPLFSWTASVSGDVAQQEVALGTTSGGAQTSAWAVQAGTSTTFTGLTLTECTGGTPVYYPSIRVTDDAGNVSSPVATHATGFRYDNTDPGAPGVPTNGSDSNSTQSPTHTWTAATDNCEVSHYQMAVGVTSGGVDRLGWTNIGNVLTYQATNATDGLLALSAGTYYYTSIRAVDYAGRTSSVVTSAQWRYIVPPAAITNLAFSNRTSSSIEVSWSAPNSNGTPITDYHVQYKETISGTWLDFTDGVSTATTANVTGLTDDTSYDIRVRAYNGGAANWSNTVTIETAINDPFFEADSFTAFNLGGAQTARIVSLEDNNAITLNGAALTTIATAGAVYNFATTTGDILESTKPFYATGRNATSNSNANEGNIVFNVPEWAGKSFLMNGSRDPEHVLTIYAFETANITIIGTGPTNISDTIAANTSQTYRINFNGAWNITSDGLITAFQYSEGATNLLVEDAMPLLPPALDIIGWPSGSGQVTSLNSGVSTSYWYGTTTSGAPPTPLTLNNGSLTTVTGTGNLYSGAPVRLQAATVIAGRSNADSNGNFTSPYLPLSMMRKRYAIPHYSTYVAFTSDQPGTIRRFNTNGTTATITLARTGTHANAPYWVRETLVPTGTIYESDIRFAGWYQPDDDANVAGPLYQAGLDESLLVGSDGKGLPVSHKLKMWLDSSDETTLWQNSDCTTSVVTTNGQSVGCWRDKSYYENHATQAAGNKPTWNSSVAKFGGRGAVDFNGGTNYLEFAESVVTGTNYTIIAVVQRDTAGSDEYFIGTQSVAATQGLHLGFRTDTQITAAHDGTNILNNTVEASATNSVGIFWARLDSTGKKVYFNADTATDATATQLASPGQGVIGLGRDANGFDGQIAELIVYDRGLMDSELDLLETYLRDKWLNPNQADSMRLWLDASDTSTLYSNAGCSTPITTGGTSVLCWGDKSGSGYQAVQSGTSPVWNADSGRNAVLFTNDNLRISAGVIGALFDAGQVVQDLTVVALARSTSTTESGYLFYHPAGSTINGSIPFTANTVRFQMNGSGNGELSSGAWGAGTGQPYMWSFMNDVTGGNQYIYRDGTQVATDATTGSVTIGTENFFLGSSSTPGNYQNANIHEFFVFRKTLTDAERAMIRAYLMNKWNMP